LTIIEVTKCHIDVMQRYIMDTSTCALVTSACAVATSYKFNIV